MEKLYTIYDKKMNTYMPPVISPNIAVMTRDLQEIVNTKKDSKLAKYPADHDLYELGNWDSSMGDIDKSDKPIFIINLQELKGEI